MADSDVTRGLLEAMRAVALDDIMTAAVKQIEELRGALSAITERGGDIAEQAVALHRLSISLDRLQRLAARARDQKLTKLRDEQGWTFGAISKSTTIERSLVAKLVKKGRRA
jgi:hypothetical protein